MDHAMEYRYDRKKKGNYYSNIIFVTAIYVRVFSTPLKALIKYIDTCVYRVSVFLCKFEHSYQYTEE